MMQNYRWAAFSAWIAMASMAIAGFAAFSPPDPDATDAALGAVGGGVAALAFHDPGHTSPAAREVPASTQRWADTIRRYFAEPDIDRALTVVFCESSGDPRAVNPSSSASGLFQHLPTFWDERSTNAGFTGADIHDPEANVAVAAWLVYEGGGWRHWYPSAGCWGPGPSSLG